MPAPPINMQSGMPKMAAAFAGWTSALTLIKRTQVVTDGLVGYSDQTITFQGTVQPLSPKQIALKPEGERAWTWLQIHCVNGGLKLNVTDEIIFNGAEYKVMARLDYTQSNYMEYHCVREYQ